LSRRDEDGYCPVANNCEHFCTGQSTVFMKVDRSSAVAC
jgi:hypothetical protein